MQKIDLNFFDSIDPLVKLIEYFEPEIHHGVIVYGSYSRERFTKNRLHLTLNPRDIDVIILKENGEAPPKNFEVGGFKFDVHQLEIRFLWDAVKEHRSPKWIQNLFTSALVYHKTEAPLELMNFVNEIRKMPSGSYLQHLNAEEQFLIMQNFIHKIKSKPNDVMSFANFLYPMIQTIYYFKCLKDGAWPHMHPPRAREDIRERYHAMDKMLSEIESDGVTWTERSRIVEKLVLSEMPAFL